jgi:phenylalanyl-tRNA synthetase beta chain
MIISLRWLQEYVDIGEYLKKPEALADILTAAGLEVENIVNRAKDFEFVVTGHILTKDKHPNADKLSLCQVTTGAGVVHQIVCGAQNHKSGDKVVVALPGAVLPGNFMIKKAAVRGIESGGMLCSEKELGLAKESQGIMILPESAPIGKPFAQVMGLDDVTFELKVTPNRADCLSHYGLAREVACLIDKPLKELSPELKISEQSTKKEIDVNVTTPEMCPRYAGRYLAGIKVSDSPVWLKKRLESIGLNSINNIVDVTNFVMMELGQPLHAFDAGEIKGQKITVGLAEAGEVFETLDGTQLKMKGDELMIRDSERAVAMAGVVGGKNSGVSPTTRNLFIESAYFNPMTVRKAARTHGINTDSAYRFSRGVDPEGTVKAMNRACELIIQLAGGVVYDQHHDFYPRPVRKHPIRISVDTVSERLGYPAKAEVLENYMLRLGCQTEKLNDSEFQVLPPAFRFDLEHEMDIVEEYARLNGYEHIPETLPATSVEPARQDEKFVFSQKVSGLLRKQGFMQALNFAFVGEKDQQAFIQNIKTLQDAGLSLSEKAIRLLNPLSDDLNVMRSTLSYGLFRNALYNFHQGNESGRLFEIGKSFSWQASYQEVDRLAVVAWGHHENLWEKNGAHPLIFEVKSALEALLSGLQIHSFLWQQSNDKGLVPSFLHYGQFAHLILAGQPVGFIGTLHPLLAEDNKIRVPLVIAEIELEAFREKQTKGLHFRSVSKFPSVTRDLALLMLKTVKAAEVIREMKKQGGALLQQVDVFDLYEGDSLEKGQKSVAFRLKFQDPNATLQDETVNKAIDMILAQLKQKFNITVR